MDVSQKTLINRVASSSLETINLEQYFPGQKILSFDLKDYLFKGLILKEHDFRESLSGHNWNQYQDAILCVFCSADAIIPVWAQMLVASYAQPHADDLYAGTPESFIAEHYDRVLSAFDAAAYQDKKVVIKGCSNKPVPASAYFTLTKVLRPYVSRMMYGEPCSTVPIFKK